MATGAEELQAVRGGRLGGAEQAEVRAGDVDKGLGRAPEEVATLEEVLGGDALPQHVTRKHIMFDMRMTPSSRMLGFINESRWAEAC